MKKIITKIIMFLFIVGIGMSGFSGSVHAEASTNEVSAQQSVNINKDRIYGNDRIETSLKISQSGWKNGSSTVVIAQGYGYADALCAGPLAKKYNAPIILSKQDGLSDETVSELKRLKASKAFVIGGKASLSDNVESELKNIGINDVERLEGATRYETSVKIAESLGNSVNSIVIASGNGYADSLSIAPIASKKGMPILLSQKDSLPDVVKNYIKKVNVNKSYVIGGTNSISDNITNSLSNVQRIGGSNRFETNLAVLQNFKSDFDFSNVYIAEGNGTSGNEFADALSGSALAAEKSAPVVLVYNTISTDTANFIKSNMSKDTVLTALGGTLVVPNTILNGIEDLFNGKTPDSGIGNPTAPTTPTNPITPTNPTSDQLHVSLVIDGYKGNIINETNLEASKGESVYDLLKSTLDSKGIKFVNKGTGGSTTGASVYISSIDGETEFDRPRGNGQTNQSGWKYSVDGTFPNHGCGVEYINNDNEKIHWIYVVGAWDETQFRDVDSITLNKTDLTLNANQTESLTATVSPSNATDKNVTWESSDKTVATVDSNGKVTAINSGTATITASSIDNTKGFRNYTPQSDSCKVTVKSNGNIPSSISVTGITLDKTGTVAVGGTLQLKALVQPDNATDKNVNWSSSDKTIAAVDGKGLVTGIKEGTATITAATEDENKTAACTITVKNSQTKDYTSSINNLINGISSIITSDNCDDWIALGLNKTGNQVPKDYLSKLQDRITSNTKGGVLDLGRPTEYERTTLAVLAAGGDPTNISGQNLIEKMCNSDMDSQGINAYVFGLIALDSKNFKVPDNAKWTRDALIKVILNNKTKDGGWSYAGDSADPDMTGMAISALAPYYSTNSDVKSAVDVAVNTLSKIQKDDGGFVSCGIENSESSAQVIIGLCANGIDPTTDSRFVRNGKNPMDSLLSFATSDNKGFGHTDTSLNGMSTEQGLEAVAAYNLFKSKGGSLYKF
ncbi:cell wall-binding repeat-containing protein [Clostridium ljungdahlii]|uniref:N-acetylmuramoyl-L-alanine amidase LytC n=1 Tax=Clostridium ljungdahlii TaxID=1538 RepID=A0A162LDG7_9CLOT|nr:cell wall-binding repeat-containing protein [Clostridium ljungdahlii]OAA92076.1 N-acetylmuramoyl-L-alanine amidase LytC precursor [Clostridium ljungdahlii]